MRDMPMPGELLPDGTRVIASTMYYEPEHDDDDQTAMFTLLVLNPAPPYYTVKLVYGNDELGVAQEVSHRNIVPAVNGDEYPNPDPARAHMMTGPKAHGYIDLGGDY